MKNKERFIDELENAYMHLYAEKPDKLSYAALCIIDDIGFDWIVRNSLKLIQEAQNAPLCEAALIACKALGLEPKQSAVKLFLNS